MLSRRTFLGSMAGGAGLALSGALGRTAHAAPKRPNLIVCMTDDHALHAISAYGSTINKTPNIDRLATEGMKFTNCCVTNSICAPCRAVILTGKHSHLNGQITNGMRFDGGQQNFAKLLQKAGYQTAMIGKWHLKSDPTGFDYSEVLLGQGPYYNPPMKRNGTVRKHTGYTTDIITDLALQWLDKDRDKSKPFCLLYWHKAPHRNWQPGPKHLTMYDGVTIPEPPTLWDDYSHRSSAAKTQTMTIERHLNPNDLKLTQPRGLTPEQLKAWNAAYAPKNAAFKKANPQGKALVRWKYQRYIKDYLRCIASVDDNLGRVLKYLDDTGLAKDTAVMYTSDQGFYLGDHGWYDKRWMFRESFHNACLVRWPGVVKPGSECDALCQNLDYAPTFLDMAGAPVPADMQGVSLKPLLEGKRPAEWRKSVYYHYYEFPGAHSVRRHYGVFDGGFKLIYYYNLDEWELFDLKKDPHELRSVYADPAYAGTVARLKAELARLRKLYKVPEDTRPVGRPPSKKRPAKGPAKK